MASIASATSHIAQFVFITEPRTVKPGEISEEIIVQAQDSAGNAAAPGETIDLEFGSSSATGEFLNSSADSVSKIWNSNWKNRTFYYRDSAEGVHTLTVKATGRTSRKKWEASQKITVSGGNSAAPPPSSSTMPPSSSLSSSKAVPPPTIKAYAGEDRIVAVGSEINFLGHATGLDGKPLDTARFWWNFGDGASKEGRSVGHVFMIPGEYTVGLHISAGEYAASDYLKVRVIPNQIEVSGVVIGERGYLKIKNPSTVEIEIGGWIIEDATGQRFIIPPRTKIGAGAEVAFVNSTTGLFKSGPARLTVYYSNLTKALDWEEDFNVIPSASKESPSVIVSGPAAEASAQAGAKQSPKIAASSDFDRNPRNDEGGDSSPTPTAIGGDQNDNQANVPSELAQTSDSSPPAQLLFWIAFAISILAAAGFIVSKKFIA